jgi:hypothetical protein
MSARINCIKIPLIKIYYIPKKNKNKTDNIIIIDIQI